MSKKELRILYKSIRNSISDCEKIKFDKSVFTRFINSDLYKKSKLILVYVSVGSETDTLDIIKFALNDGKFVAVPYCSGSEMKFYRINSLDCLSTGKYGIPTVTPDDDNLVGDYEQAVCVVPALSLDLYGNRLGYGGGYYDRFLSDKSIFTVGLCYERCIHSCLPLQEHDIKVNYILTENIFKKL